MLKSLTVLVDSSICLCSSIFYLVLLLCTYTLRIILENWYPYVSVMWQLHDTLMYQYVIPTYYHFSFNFEEWFLRVQNFSFFFLNTLKYFHSALFLLKLFWEVGYNSYLCFCIGKVFPPPSTDFFSIYV